MTMGKDEQIDYYEVLQCDRTATTEELKKSYQRLLLSSHPDKVVKVDDDNFLLIQKAWSVLKDFQSRKQYDAMLSCHENSALLLYDTISLSDMIFEAEQDIYTYSCRCGGTYTLSKDFVETGVIIGCDECSFSIEVK